jgi:integrase
VVESSGLENRRRFTPSVGSNPTPSAKPSAIREGERIAPAAADRRTLANLIDHYLEGPVAQLDREAAQRRDGWLRAEKTAVTRRRHLAWWRSRIGHVRLRALAPGDIAAARDALAGRFAPATVNRYLSTLGVVLKVAVNEWGWLPDSPLRRVARKKEPPGCGRPLTQDELARLFAACRSSREWRLYPAVVLAVSTGMRHAEVMNLTWSQVDLDAGTILLRFTKNDQVRRVPLQAQALEIIRELARTRRRVGVDYVFARRDARKPKAIHVSWAHARAEAGLLADGRRFRWHDLRVSAATWLAENGATVFDLMLIFGWKTPAMAARYVRMTDQRAAALVAATTTKLSRRTLDPEAGGAPAGGSPAGCNASPAPPVAGIRPAATSGRR